MKTEVPILCDVFSPAKNAIFFNLQTLSQTNHKKYRHETLCVNILLNCLTFEKINLFSPFALILSVQTHSVRGVRRCHLLKVAQIWLGASFGRGAGMA